MPFSVLVCQMQLEVGGGTIAVEQAVVMSISFQPVQLASDN